jgi:hypothetical protein
LFSLVVVQAIPGFNGLDEDLRSTFLNLIQELMMKYWWNCKPSNNQWGLNKPSNNQWGLNLEVACQRLAIVQDRAPSEIRKFVGFLSQGF